MAKQKNKANTVVNKIAPLPELQPSLFHLGTFKLQAIVIAIVAFGFYFNSIFNEFALDDGIVIIKNHYVQKGVKGIPEILSKDAYDSFYRQMNAKDQLSGGRYRPLSIVTFAIEQQFIGTTPDGKMPANPSDFNKNNINDPDEDLNGDGLWNEYDWSVRGMQFRHFINVLIFIGSLLVMLQFLRLIVFPSMPDVAFLATLLFAIHPMHTEVVANIKSRDEIMSLLFICATFIYAFKYRTEKKTGNLIKAMLCFFLALLSKEYAITLIVLIPLMLYLFNKESLAASIKAFVPYSIVIVIYLMIRFSIVVLKADVPDNEVLNNPYLFASKSQKLATEISTTLNYLKLLVWPHPLSADYSYNQISYKDFSHPSVILSLIVHVGLIVAAFRLFIKRNPLVFAIAFYLLNIFLVCNIFLNIGATMGERLAYHSSFGFCIAVAFLLIKGIEKLKNESNRKTILYPLLGIVLVLSAFKTTERNADWKNDITLFTKDVNTVTESALANGNAGARYIDLSERPVNKNISDSLVKKAVVYLTKAIKIHPRYVTSYLNLGIAYLKLSEPDNAKQCFDLAKAYFPHYPDINRYYTALGNGYFQKGMQYGGKKQFTEAIQEIIKGTAVDPNNPELWYNLGGAYYTTGQIENAKNAWQKTLQLNPNHQQAQQGYAAIQQIINQPKK